MEAFALRGGGGAKSSSFDGRAARLAVDFLGAVDSVANGSSQPPDDERPRAVGLLLVVRLSGRPRRRHRLGRRGGNGPHRATGGALDDPNHAVIAPRGRTHGHGRRRRGRPSLGLGRFRRLCAGPSS